MELASIETIKKFVSIGMSISIIPKIYAKQESEQGTLSLLHLENLKLVRKLGLIYRRDRYLSRACLVFLEVVEQSMEAIPAQEKRPFSGTSIDP